MISINDTLSNANCILSNVMRRMMNVEDMYEDSCTSNLFQDSAPAADWNGVVICFKILHQLLTGME